MFKLKTTTLVASLIIAPLSHASESKCGKACRWLKNKISRLDCRKKKKEKIQKEKNFPMPFQSEKNVQKELINSTIHALKRGGALESLSTLGEGMTWNSELAMCKSPSQSWNAR
jgi:hypothetical protein